MFDAKSANDMVMGPVWFIQDHPRVTTVWNCSLGGVLVEIATRNVGASMIMAATGVALAAGFSGMTLLIAAGSKKADIKTTVTCGVIATVIGYLAAPYAFPMVPHP